MSVLQETEKRLRRVKRHVTAMVKGPELEPWPSGSRRCIQLIYWRPKTGFNFGDELSRVVVQLMLARKGITPEDELQEPRRMLAIGSVLHHAQDDTIIWGTGRNGVIPDRAHFFDRLDVRAVRGPKTAEYLRAKGIEVPEVFGDPGLLLPRLIGDRFPIRGGHGAAFVPNLNDFRAGHTFENATIPVIDPRRDWNLVVADILSRDFIVASSLHGLVVAEAFGIPARYVRVSGEEPMFKYEDYYQGTGRMTFQPAGSIAEALEMGGEPALSKPMDALFDAFPYDVWT